MHYEIHFWPSQLLPLKVSGIFSARIRSRCSEVGIDVIIVNPVNSPLGQESMWRDHAPIAFSWTIACAEQRQSKSRAMMVMNKINEYAGAL